MSATKKRIAIFASGSGTNADRIMAHFKDHPACRVELILTNKAQAGVLQFAATHQVPSHVFNRQDFYQGRTVLDLLRKHQIDWIVLAGFLWLIPEYLIQEWPKRIINIHPALLPDFGGKGMFGMYVHQAVSDSGRQQTGITIHYVNKAYDEGAIIFQASCTIQPHEAATEIASRIRKLEHRYFPQVIESLVCVPHKTH